MSGIQKRHFDLNHWFKHLKKTDQLLLVGFLITVVLTGAALILMPKFFYKTPKIEPSAGQIQIQAASEPKYRHPLTGIPLYEDIGSPQVFSVMIDNHEDAWPPSGVEDAFLVSPGPGRRGDPSSTP